MDRHGARSHRRSGSRPARRGARERAGTHEPVPVPRSRVQVRTAQRDHQRLRVGRLDLAMRDPQHGGVVRRAAALHLRTGTGEAAARSRSRTPRPAREAARDAAHEQRPVAEGEVPGPARVVDVGEAHVRAQGRTCQIVEVVEDRQHLDRRSPSGCTAAGFRATGSRRCRRPAGTRGRCGSSMSCCRPGRSGILRQGVRRSDSRALGKVLPGSAMPYPAEWSTIAVGANAPGVARGTAPSANAGAAATTGPRAWRPRWPRTRSVGRPGASGGSWPASPPQPCDRPTCDGGCRHPDRCARERASPVDLLVATASSSPSMPSGASSGRGHRHRRRTHHRGRTTCTAERVRPRRVIDAGGGAVTSGSSMPTPTSLSISAVARSRQWARAPRARAVAAVLDAHDPRGRRRVDDARLP